MSVREDREMILTCVIALKSYAFALKNTGHALDADTSHRVQILAGKLSKFANKLTIKKHMNPLLGHIASALGTHVLLNNPKHRVTPKMGDILRIGKKHYMVTWYGVGKYELTPTSRAGNPIYMLRNQLMNTRYEIIDRG